MTHWFIRFNDKASTSDQYNEFLHIKTYKLEPPYKKAIKKFADFCCFLPKLNATFG